MGQLVTTVVGGVAGFMIGGPFGAQVGMMLGGMIGATLFGPTIHGPRLQELKVAASTYGVAIPEIYGTVRVGGNMIWTSGINENKKTSRAGKGGPKQTTYTYDATFATALCKGPIDDVLRVWADSKIIYDATNGSSRAPIKSGAGSILHIIAQMFMAKKKRKTASIQMRVYTGTEDQLPDSLIEAHKGAGNVSAHRGLAYVVFEKLLLENFGNRIPQLTFEVTKSRSPSITSIVTKDDADEIVDTSARQFVADFETGRLLSYTESGNDLWSYDLTTMGQIGHDSAAGINAADSIALMHGSNLLLVTNPTTTEAFGFYNTTTMQWGNKYGTLLTVDDGHNVYTEADDALTFTKSARVGYGRYSNNSGEGFHIVHTDYFGKLLLMTSTAQLLGEIDAPFAPHFFLEGKRASVNSQIIGWRPANDRLELFTITTPGSAVHEVSVSEGTGDYVLLPAEFTTSAVNLTPYPGEVFLPAVLLYDNTDDYLFCLGTSNGVVTAFKYSLETATYKFTAKYPTAAMPTDTIGLASSRIEGGTFGWVAQPAGSLPTLTQIDLLNGSVDSSITLETEFGYTFGVSGPQIWDDANAGIMGNRSEGGVTQFNRVFVGFGVSALTIPAVVQDICLRSGVLTQADVDVSELNDDPIIGYLIDRTCTARDALKQLATGYLFDAYESDYQLKFRSRGGDPVVTITEDWMQRASDGQVITENLTQELEMPLRISVNYYDVTRDHQQGSQFAKRKAAPFPTMWTSKEDVIELPISWDPDDAKQCADKLLKMAWANRTGYQFELPFRYLKYDPTDVVEVAMESGATYNMRLSDANIGGDFSIQIKGVSEEAASYVSTATGATSESPQQVVAGTSTAYPMVINTPLLRDTDYDISGNSICYLSAGTTGTAFTGTVIFMHDGIEYQAVGAIDSGTVSGYSITALPKVNNYESTDEETIIRVRLSDVTMELESVTQDDMLNLGANAALIGDEIIQFRDAAQQANGEWWLSGILRARRGTDYAVRGHTIGERFLMLDTASVIPFYRAPESYVTTRQFKAASGGSSLSAATALTADLIPRDLMPYSPAGVKIIDDATTVTISCFRRSRVYAGLENGTGTIHYREGDLVSARIDYKVFTGKTVDDIALVTNADISGSMPIFDSAGTEIATSFTFPLADLGSETKILVCLTEHGEVDGTPKWVAFDRVGLSDWNRTDFY